MISTDDRDIYEFCKSLRSHGWTRELESDDYSKNNYTSKFENAFKFVLPGYNLRPNELNGVLGQCQLKSLVNFLKVEKKCQFF